MTNLERANAYFANDRYATDVTGITITEVREHYAKVELELDERHMNAMGAVMGGVYFTLCDFAFAVASSIVISPCPISFVPDSSLYKMMYSTKAMMIPSSAGLKTENTPRVSSRANPPPQIQEIIPTQLIPFCGAHNSFFPLQMTQ